MGRLHLALLFSVGLLASPAHAGTSAAPKWTHDFGSAAFGIQPASDGTNASKTIFSYFTGTTTGPTATTLYKIDQTGTVTCSGVLPAAEVAQGAPVPVTLSDKNTYVFLTTDLGNVYKYAVAGCPKSGWTPVTQHNLKRRMPPGLPTSALVCTIGSGDTITANPTVALKSIAGGPSQDLVIIPTRYGCTSTDNRVIALDAATLSTIVFQSNKTAAPADYFADGCTLDYTNSLIYCGAHDSGGPFQNTLFAYAMSSSGASVTPFFQVKPGSMVNHAVIRANRLIVATQEGSVVSYDISAPVSGTAPTEAWRLSMTGLSFQTAPWAEFRFGFQNIILLRSQDGSLHRIDENRDYVVPANDRLGATVVGGAVTPPGIQGGFDTGSSFMGVPAIFADQGKIYATTNTGYIHQIDITGTGFSAASLEAYANVGGASVVYDPILDFEPTTYVVNRLMAAGVSATQTQLREWNIPWVPGDFDNTSSSPWQAGPFACATDADCSAAIVPTNEKTCSIGQCNKATGFCNPLLLPVNNGTNCPYTDCQGNNLTGVCSDGQCRVPNTNGCCPADATGVCAQGNSCCATGCIPINDVHNCGGCGHDCDPATFMHRRRSGEYRCVVTGANEAHCEREPKLCATPTIAEITTAVPTNVSQIAWSYVPTFNAAGDPIQGPCNAYVGSTKSASTYYQVAPGQTDGTAIQPKAGYNTLPLLDLVMNTIDANAFQVAPVFLSGAVQSDAASGGCTNGTCGGWALDQQTLNPSPLFTIGKVAAGSSAYLDPAWGAPGMVGPAMNSVFANGKHQMRLYFGNWPNDGDISFVDSNVWSAAAGWVFPKATGTLLDKLPNNGRRINSIIYTVRHIRNPDVAVDEGTLVFARDGDAIVHFYCDPTFTNVGRACQLPQGDVDLSGPGYLDVADPDGTAPLPLVHIMNMEVDPVYGGVVVAGRDAGLPTTGVLPTAQTIYIDPNGLGARNYNRWPFFTGTPPAAAFGQSDIRPSLNPVGSWILNYGGNGGFRKGGPYAPKVINGVVR